jgi:hypothetical protein
MEMLQKPSYAQAGALLLLLLEINKENVMDNLCGLSHIPHAKYELPE